jgi:hypothetical protein
MSNRLLSISVFYAYKAHHNYTNNCAICKHGNLVLSQELDNIGRVKQAIK